MQNIAKFIGALALMLAAMSANAQRSTQVTDPAVVEISLVALNRQSSSEAGVN